MATLTVRLPDDKHQRLKRLAEQRKISMNKLVEELTTIALTEFDAQQRFLLRASSGDAAQALKILRRLDDEHN